MTPIAPYHDKDEWLQERQSGLGGSDGAAVAEVSPFRSPLDVYLEKTDDLAPDEPTWRMLWGNIAEPVAAELYAEKTGRKIRRQPLRRHPDHNFLIANVDRQILTGAAGITSTGCLEIKCPGIGAFSKIKAHGLPDYAILQLQHYLGVLGYSWGSFAIFNSESGPPIHFDMEADQNLIESLFEREQKFWTEHVIPRIPPPETIGGEALDIPEVEGELKIIDDPEWMEAAINLQEAKELLGAAGNLEKAAKQKLQELMSEANTDAVEVSEFARIYWKEQAGRASWKKTAEKLAKEAGLKVDDYKVVGKPSRAFRPYFLKGQANDSG